MPERTAVVRRVAEVVDGRGDVAVVGVPCPWRDELVDELAQWLPGVTVQGYDAVPDGVGATVGLELSEQEAAWRVLRAEWEGGGRRARGGPLDSTGRWVPRPPGQVDDEPPAAPAPDVDVVFVPVSGVRPPRRLRLFWDESYHVLWDDDNAHLGELEDLLPLSPASRARIARWTRVGHPGAGRTLAAALAEEVGPEFVVDT